MKRAKNNYAATRDEGQSTGELLILPDGRILAHNITPSLARLLAEVNPSDETMRRRAGVPVSPPFPSPDRSPSTP
jgi:hypothetical protein